jgi:UDPglucose 6-dehydrogenase
VFCATYDTPVDEEDHSDVNFVLNQLRSCLLHLSAGTLVIISSQLPVGTCRQIEGEFPQLRVVCVPENLRLGQAILSFEKPERIVIGLRQPEVKPLLVQLFRPFCQQLIWMKTESAEMVKHALNAFLALSVSFINEIARLCEHTGADAAEVSTGLKSDVRIGAKAYLSPGSAFAGGTLARDVVSLTALAREANVRLDLIPAIKPSNDQHSRWALHHLETLLEPLAGRTIAILGLTYKTGTSTLRRSTAVELCDELLARQADVRAFDPVVRQLPEGLQAVQLAGSLAEALDQAEAAVVCTEWPELRSQAWPELVLRMKRRLILDPNRFLDQMLVSNIEHLSVGRAS